MKARCKTGIVASRNGPLAHRSNYFAAYVEDGKIRYVATYLCGNRSSDVTILADPDARYEMCEPCEDAAKGPCMYRCFNEAGDLLYVGSTKAYLRRLQSHNSQSEWWPEVADVKAERFPTLLEARVAERHAIDNENPLRNRQLPGRNAVRRAA